MLGAFIHLIRSAQGVFDLILLFVLIFSFYYLKGLIMKRDEHFHQKNHDKIIECRDVFENKIEEKLNNEIEKLELKIKFLEKIIDQKLKDY